MLDAASPSVVLAALLAGGLLCGLALAVAVRATMRRTLLLGAVTMAGLVLVDRWVTGAALSSTVAPVVALVLFVATGPSRKDAAVALCAGLGIAGLAAWAMVTQDASVALRFGAAVIVGAAVTGRAVWLGGVTFCTGAIGLAALAAAGAFFEGTFAAMHLVLLGASVLVFVADQRPGPTLALRDGLVAVLIGVAALILTLPTWGVQAWAVGVGAGAFALAIAAASYHLLPGPRWRPAPDERDASAPRFVPDALTHLAPLLDDAHLRGPDQPRVPMRVSARRLLDAALASARGAQPDATRADLRVELRLSQADADIECDAVEVSTALGAVLDNALRLRALSPEVAITVHVRGGPASVTFEILDQREWPETMGDGPLPAVEPFRQPRRHDATRPGHGLGLARAQMIVERYGGTFITQRTKSGRVVQLTFPRRPDRTQRALA